MMGKTMVLIAGLLDETSPTPSTTPSEVPNVMSQTNNIFDLIKLIFILLFILVGAYLTSKYISKLSLGQIKDSNFKVIDTYRISPNKFLQIVKAGGKFLVIAVSKESIQFITELDETEVIVKEFPSKDNMNFKQILEKIRNKT